MRIKLLLVVFAAVAGAGASYALAAAAKGPDHPAPPCRPLHLHGVMASPSSFVVTIQKAGPKDVVTVGQVVTLTLGGPNQKIVADAEACSSGTGSTATLTTRHLNLHASPPPKKAATTTTTTTHS
jgi:hypothetical protein